VEVRQEALYRASRMSSDYDALERLVYAQTAVEEMTDSVDEGTHNDHFGWLLRSARERVQETEQEIVNGTIAGITTALNKIQSSLTRPQE
jgi:hypothetical protein